VCVLCVCVCELLLLSVYGMVCVCVCVTLGGKVVFKVRLCEFDFLHSNVVYSSYFAIY